jgi:hypothetical protein
VELSSVEVVEHFGCAHQHDASRCLAGTISDGTRKESLARARSADEERVDAAVEKGQVVQPEVASANLLSARVPVEVESVDGVDLGKLGCLDSLQDRTLKTAGFLFIAEAVDEIERDEIAFRGFDVKLCETASHAGQTQPAELLGHDFELVVAIHEQSSEGRPGSLVTRAGNAS